MVRRPFSGPANCRCDFLKHTLLGQKTYPNQGEYEIPVAVSSLLPEAVAEARHYMSGKRKPFQEGTSPRLEKEMQALAGLLDRQLSFLEIEYPEDAALAGARRNKKLERKRRIDKNFADYRRWVEETMTTEDSPFLRVAAVLLG